jgi:hypothetical protein
MTYPDLGYPTPRTLLNIACTLPVVFVAGWAATVPPLADQGLPPPSRPASPAAPAPPTSPPNPPSTQPAADLLRSWLAAHAPGEQHHRLDPIAGEWDVEGWWRPPLPPIPGQTVPERIPLSGRVNAEWVLDGRFLRAEFRGKTLEVPYTGWHILGYNAAAGEYQLVLMESTTTTVNTFAGRYDEAAGTITFAGKIADPAVNGAYRAVLHLGKDTLRFEGFQVNPDQSEVQVSEHTYTRRAK